MNPYARGVRENVAVGEKRSKSRANYLPRDPGYQLFHTPVSSAGTRSTHERSPGTGRLKSLRAQPDLRFLGSIGIRTFSSGCLSAAEGAEVFFYFGAVVGGDGVVAGQEDGAGFGLG